jgi:predicted ATPase
MRRARHSSARKSDRVPGEVPFEGVTIDEVSESVHRDGVVLRLRPKVYAVLAYLLERPGELVSKSELLNAVWGDVHVEESVLKATVNYLRRAIGDDAHAPNIVETVRGKGYRLVATPVRVRPSAVSLSDAAGPQPPRDFIIGRQAALLQLTAALGDGMQGRRRMMFITGEPGIGKTAIVDEFMRSVGAQVTLARARCIEHEPRAEAHVPLLALVTQLCRLRQGPSFVEVLRQLAPSWVPYLPALEGERPWPGVSAESLAASDGSFAVERMSRELAAAFEVFSEKVPLVLALEDLHRADPLTLELLSRIARGSAPARLLMLLTLRSGELRRDAPVLRAVRSILDTHRSCQELWPSRLDADEIRDYLERRFPKHDFPAGFAGALREHTGGNPLFLVSVLDSLVSERQLQQVGARWHLLDGMSVSSQVIPRNVTALVEHQLSRVPEHERRVLEAASAAGPVFSSEPVAAICLESELTVEALCRSWARDGVFLSEEPLEAAAGSARAPRRFKFSHGMCRELVYASMSRARQGECQLRMSEWTERRDRDTLARLLGRAQPFMGGVDVASASRAAEAAGRSALRRSAYREAIAHFATALELQNCLPDDVERQRARLKLLVAMAGPFTALRGYSAPETESVYREAVTLCERLSQTRELPTAFAGMASTQLSRAAYDAADQTGSQLIELGERAEDTGVELQGHLVLGISSFYQAQLARSELLLERALALYDTQQPFHGQDAWVTARALGAWLSWHKGDDAEALARIDAAEEYARERDDFLGLAFVLNGAVFLHYVRSDFEALDQAASRLEHVAREHDLAFFQPTPVLARGISSLRRGNEADGLEALERAWNARQASGARIGQSCWTAVLAECYLKAGRAGIALNLLTDGFDAQSQGERIWGPELYRVYALLPPQISSTQRRRLTAFFNLPESSESALEEALDRARAMRSVGFESRLRTLNG